MIFNFVIFLIFAHLISIGIISNAPKIANLPGLINIHGFDLVGYLDSDTILTLTVVTGSLSNTQIVSSFFQTFEGFNISDQTDMHFKLTGRVSLISQVFNTSFGSYKSEHNQNVFFASSRKVSIPKSIQTETIAVLGLENVSQMKPNFMPSPFLQNNFKSADKSTYFTPLQLAKKYGYPNSDGAGVKVGIISMGGFFNQSDLDKYFSLQNLSTVPIVNVVYINGATQNSADTNGTIETYIDIEIISSIVPGASLTVYFALNNIQAFYDSVRMAFQHEDVVSVTWSIKESLIMPKQKDCVQVLLSKYSNVPFLVGTGDLGSEDNVMFPANCPNAIGMNLLIKKIPSYDSNISYFMSENNPAW